MASCSEIAIAFWNSRWSPMSATTVRANSSGVMALLRISHSILSSYRVLSRLIDMSMIAWSSFSWNSWGNGADVMARSGVTKLSFKFHMNKSLTRVPLVSKFNLMGTICSGTEQLARFSASVNTVLYFSRGASLPLNSVILTPAPLALLREPAAPSSS
ncbi:hypothetical protein OGAPHI_005879 [Ogataea philodendri]|uniref:Uncharacterized protein n=1 Tax=Ogataea philodendri TaxID=1378263 RepID=A0A9P8NZV5_9ASCO|nr:uncharacterized protein OGAPHI_005879 [Ogataea philodendri]KAH3662627.1 hypothetical protein OGAPHI_005879 [Ogataea philodendri]